MNEPIIPHRGPWIIWHRALRRTGERPGAWQKMAGEFLTKADALEAIWQRELTAIEDRQEYQVLVPGEYPKSDPFASRLRR